MFNLQGHRGARGLKPENTLPSFEAALDAGVTSIETDLHLTRDGEVILCHDAAIHGQLLRTLTLDQLRGHPANANPDPARFPDQDSAVTPLAALFVRHRSGTINSGSNQSEAADCFFLPTLNEFFEFVKAYASSLGQQAGKSAEQRARAEQMVFDLELKRVPGRPKWIGDGFDGRGVGLLEERVLDTIHQHGVVERTVVRSFDHRSVRAIKDREPRLRTAVLIANLAPVAPENLVVNAGASIYCPDLNFLDEMQVRQLHQAGIAVLPWTVNHPADWDRLLAWGVDGITTDYPDRLAAMLRERGIEF